MYYQQVDSKQMPRIVDSMRSITNSYAPHQLARQPEEQEQRQQPLAPPSLHQQQLQHQMPQLQQQAQQPQQPYLPPVQLHNQIYQQNLLQHQLSVIQQHFQAFQMQKQDQHDPLYSYQPFERPNCYKQLDHHHKQSPQQHQQQPLHQQQHVQAVEIPPRPNQQSLEHLNQQLHSNSSSTTKRNRDHKRKSKDSDSHASASSPELNSVQQSGRIKRSGRANRADGKPKRVRTIFTPEQLRRLEQFFSNKSYLVAGDRNSLADELCLTGAQVKVWFQNRRIKERRLKPGVTTPVPLPGESWTEPISSNTTSTK